MRGVCRILTHNFFYILHCRLGVREKEAELLPERWTSEILNAFWSILELPLCGAFTRAWGSDQVPICMVLFCSFPRRSQCSVNSCHHDFRPWLLKSVSLLNLSFSPNGRAEFVMKHSLSFSSYGHCVWCSTGALWVRMAEKSCDIFMFLNSTTLSDLWWCYFSAIYRSYFCRAISTQYF